MTKELATIPSRLPSREEMEILQSVAKFAADSKHFEKLGGIGGIFCVGMYAFEIGISPMVALYGGMQNIMGKITIAPEMLMALIREKGHKIEILETTDKICRIKGTRKDTGESYTSVYEITEAERAGLVKQGGAWTKNPSDMLFARCSGRLKRRLFPDVATKAYVEGEREEAQVEEVRTASSPSEQTHIPGIIVQPVEELISAQTAAHMEEQIEKFITPIRADYRQNILKHFKVESFDKIPLSKQTALMKSITTNIEDIKKKELDGPGTPVAQ
jgi:hypothetical protein